MWRYYLMLPKKDMNLILYRYLDREHTSSAMVRNIT